MKYSGYWKHIWESSLILQSFKLIFHCSSPSLHNPRAWCYQAFGPFRILNCASLALGFSHSWLDLVFLNTLRSLLPFPPVLKILSLFSSILFPSHIYKQNKNWTTIILVGLSKWPFIPGSSIHFALYFCPYYKLYNVSFHAFTVYDC